MNVASVCATLQPLFDLGDFRDLNGPAGFRLAELIWPRDANDLRVSELLALLRQIQNEFNQAQAQTQVMA